jgi:aminoglycoside 3-N-acetyltransferase
VLPASLIIDRMTSEAPSYNTRSSLRDDLTRMGLIAGDTVMVHAAMSKVGPMLNGPDALSTALLDVIGPEGTLLVYTSWDSVHDDLLDDDGRVLAEWRDHVPGFDPQASRAVRMNGVIAEFVRTMPGARRSGNPGASVAAIGRLADWITADHPQDYGYGEGSPLAKLIEANGRILMVGAPWDTMTLIHHADHLANLPAKRVVRYEVPFATRAETTWRFMEEFDTTEPVMESLPENYIEQIVTAYVAGGSGREGTIGLAPSLLVDARPMLAFAIKWLEARSALPATRFGRV